MARKTIHTGDYAGFTAKWDRMEAASLAYAIVHATPEVGLDAAFDQVATDAWNELEAACRDVADVIGWGAVKLRNVVEFDGWCAYHAGQPMIITPAGQSIVITDAERQACFRIRADYITGPCGSPERRAAVVAELAGARAAHAPSRPPALTVAVTVAEPPAPAERGRLDSTHACHINSSHRTEGRKTPMRKLSEPMIDAIRTGRNGAVVNCQARTEKALIGRGIIHPTESTLTEEGRAILAELDGPENPAPPSMPAGRRFAVDRSDPAHPTIHTTAFIGGKPEPLTFRQAQDDIVSSMQSRKAWARGEINSARALSQRKDFPGRAGRVFCVSWSESSAPQVATIDQVWGMTEQDACSFAEARARVIEHHRSQIEHADDISREIRKLTAQRVDAAETLELEAVMARRSGF